MSMDYSLKLWNYKPNSNRDVMASLKTKNWTLNLIFSFFERRTFIELTTFCLLTFHDSVNFRQIMMIIKFATISTLATFTLLRFNEIRSFLMNSNSIIFFRVEKFSPLCGSTEGILLLLCVRQLLQTASIFWVLRNEKVFVSFLIVSSFRLIQEFSI